jgi:hypothetical protein
MSATSIKRKLQNISIDLNATNYRVDSVINYLNNLNISNVSRGTKYFDDLTANLNTTIQKLQELYNDSSKGLEILLRRYNTDLLSSVRLCINLKSKNNYMVENLKAIQDNIDDLQNCTDPDCAVTLYYYIVEAVKVVSRETGEYLNLKQKLQNIKQQSQYWNSQIIITRW